MSDHDRWMERVLGVALTGEGGDDSSAESEGATLRSRIGICVTDAKALADPTLLGAMGKLGNAAATAIKAGDLQRAAELVEEMEDAVTKARSAARMKEVNKTKGRVSYRTAQVEWRNARSAAFTNVRSLTNRLLSDPRITEEPDADALVGVIRGLPDLLPEFDEELEDLLEALEGPGTKEKHESLIEQARAVLRDYRASLQDDVLEKVQLLADEEFGNLDMLHVLNNALQKIENTLAA